MKINVFAPPAFALSLIPQCNALQEFTFAKAGISHFRERVHICQIQGNFIQSTKWAFPQSSIGSDRSMNRNSDFPAFYSPHFFNLLIRIFYFDFWFLFSLSLCIISLFYAGKNKEDARTLAASRGETTKPGEYWR